MKPLMSLRNICHRLSPDFCLTIPVLDLTAGIIYPLTGSNGSGKSTLLKLLALLFPPQQGTIDFTACSGSLLSQRRRITLVEQAPYLISGTVKDNLSYGLKIREVPLSRHQQLLSEALDQVGLSNLITRRITTLSSGEKQRVALARALVLKPELLLLDEPTANIDTDSVPLIEALIRQLPEQGVTVVCSTHDIEQPQRLGGSPLRMDRGQLLTP